MKILLPFISFIFFVSQNAFPQQPDLVNQPWHAKWITGPGGPITIYNAQNDPSVKDYGVFKFRKTFDLSSKPSSFIIHISGDNRYKLFINGSLVSIGPARGDLYFWNFETVDLSPFLATGKNVLSAVVWNDGKWKPEAQISYLTALIVQGNSVKEEVVNTNESWKSIRDSSYQPLPVHVPGYYVAGPGELINMKYHAGGWEQVSYNDTSWGNARTISAGLTKDAARDSRGWMLVPSSLPQMELKQERSFVLRNATGMSAPEGFPGNNIICTIPVQTKAVLLFDLGHLTNAYPTLVFSKGKNAGISLGYAEALYIHRNEKIDGGWIPILSKGNRNEIDGRIFIGKKDSLVADGNDHQTFTSLWWRTYRYLQITVETKEEPLVLEDLYGVFTGYPFVRASAFESGDSAYDQILETGWRTARLCAFETYMDCPYYEQLQYIGDARIQALVTLYNTNDDRLVRNALTLMDHSRIAEGITLSRYPTDLHQEIPTFSLWWIGMLHDYWMYRPDSSFIKDKLPGVREVLNFFQRYQGQDGSLKNTPYWIFTDWVDGRKGWKNGIAPVSKNGHSAVLDLQLMWTYQLAAEMESKLGFSEIAHSYLKKYATLKLTIQQKYWDDKRKLYADNEDKETFSQHANTLAILSGMVNRNKRGALAERILNDTTLAPASIYFKYYLHRALIRAGHGQDYLNWLGKWKENLELGLTTWAEISDVSKARSDCHAWGSSPNIEFFRTVLGIDTDAPGFKKVIIEPHLGQLESARGWIPHPNGKLSVDYKKENGKWKVQINLPAKTGGRLIWKGAPFTLHPGKNTFLI